VKHDEKKKGRKSIRLSHYDYGGSGTYFITLCVQNRTCLFGKVVDRSVLNDLGRIVATEWRRTAEIRPNVALDIRRDAKPFSRDCHIEILP
jgi:hypothetical protein